MTRVGIPAALVLLLVMAAASGCTDRASSANRDGPAAESLYRDAADLARKGRLAEALDTLRRSLESGYATPSRVLAHGRFQPLLDDPTSREQLSALLKTHARESRITMVGPHEPGRSLIVRVRIVDRSTGRNVAGALVGFQHTDARGYYLNDDDKWNPRLFGYARSDANGVAVIRTIRPSHYAPEYDADDHPAHIHFGIEADGYIPLGSEILFDDDSRLTPERLTEEKATGVPIATVQTDNEGVQRCEVAIAIDPQATTGAP